MSLYQRDSIWWVSVTAPNGQRIRRSTGTADKQQAQEYHDTLKADLWRQCRLKERPTYYWQDAVIRWIGEQGHKRSIRTDQQHLRWLHGYLHGMKLVDIDRAMLDRIKLSRKEDGNASNATVNRVLALVRSILRRAAREWDMIDNAPPVRLLSEPKRRVRWLKRDEADRLIAELPGHLAEMVRFALATGLRDSNIVGLKWESIDMQRHCAWIHADESKTGNAIAIPLNDDAIAIIRRQTGKHLEYVFTYKGEPVTRANNHAWRKALKRAGITDFRFHDLRHTWASWHVQNGTPLHVLQELGGWQSRDMVLRYAHLSPGHLADFANNVTILSQQEKRPTAKSL